MYDIAIIGAGASGLVAAVKAAELARHNKSFGANLPRIVVIEATDKIGRSILRSGNGRCNLSNECLNMSLYRNSAFVEDVFDALVKREQVLRESDSFPNDIFIGGENPHPLAHPFDALHCVLRFFADHGLMFRAEDDGRLYPAANKASVVLDVLSDAISRLGIEVLLSTTISSVEGRITSDGARVLKTADGEFLHARTVIICGGGTQLHALSGIADFAAFTPVLGPIKTQGKLTRSLDNIRSRVDASLIRDGSVVAKERGEVLFRKYGVSGIAVFNLSRYMRKGDVIRLDFLPQILAEDMERFLKNRVQVLEAAFDAKPTASQILRGMLLDRISDAVLENAGISGETAIAYNDQESAKTIRSLAHALKGFDLVCDGIGDPSICQVMRGGTAPDALCAQTLALKGENGLFVAGEIIDVDGPCGGYNLQWAFASGMLAAHADIDYLSE